MKPTTKNVENSEQSLEKDSLKISHIESNWNSIEEAPYVLKLANEQLDSEENKKDNFISEFCRGSLYVQGLRSKVESFDNLINKENYARLYLEEVADGDADLIEFIKYNFTMEGSLIGHILIKLSATFNPADADMLALIPNNESAQIKPLFNVYRENDNADVIYLQGDLPYNQAKKIRSEDGEAEFLKSKVSGQVDLANLRFLISFKKDTREIKLHYCYLFCFDETVKAHYKNVVKNNEDWVEASVNEQSPHHIVNIAEVEEKAKKAETYNESIKKRLISWVEQSDIDDSIKEKLKKDVIKNIIKITALPFKAPVIDGKAEVSNEQIKEQPIIDNVPDVIEAAEDRIEDLETREEPEAISNINNKEEKINDASAVAKEDIAIERTDKIADDDQTVPVEENPAQSSDEDFIDKKAVSLDVNKLSPELEKIIVVPLEDNMLKQQNSNNAIPNSEVNQQTVKESDSNNQAVTASENNLVKKQNNFNLYKLQRFKQKQAVKIALVEIDDVLEIDGKPNLELIRHLKNYDEVWLFTQRSKLTQQQIFPSAMEANGKDYRTAPLMLVLESHDIKHVKVSTPVDSYFEDRIPGEYYVKELSSFENLSHIAGQKYKIKAGEEEQKNTGLDEEQIIEEIKKEIQLVESESNNTSDSYAITKKEQRAYLLDYLKSVKPDLSPEVTYFDKFDKDEINVEAIDDASETSDVDGDILCMHYVKKGLSCEYFNALQKVQAMVREGRKYALNLISSGLLTEESFGKVGARLVENGDKVDQLNKKILEYLKKPTLGKQDNKRMIAFCNAMQSCLEKNFKIIHALAKAKIDSRIEKLCNAEERLAEQKQALNKREHDFFFGTLSALERKNPLTVVMQAIEKKYKAEKQQSADYQHSTFYPLLQEAEKVRQEFKSIVSDVTYLSNVNKSIETAEMAVQKMQEDYESLNQSLDAGLAEAKSTIQNLLDKIDKEISRGDGFGLYAYFKISGMDKSAKQTAFRKLKQELITAYNKLQPGGEQGIANIISTWYTEDVKEVLKVRRSFLPSCFPKNSKPKNTASMDFVEKIQTDYRNTKLKRS